MAAKSKQSTRQNNLGSFETNNWNKETYDRFMKHYAPETDRDGDLCDDAYYLYNKGYRPKDKAEMKKKYRIKEDDAKAIIDWMNCIAYEKRHKVRL